MEDKTIERYPLPISRGRENRSRDRPVREVESAAVPKPGRYHIARKIADGGMAEIFLGSQHGLEGFERPVVLKRILAPLVADPQFRNMLIDEAHVAMGLNHSNIVQVLDLGHVSGRYFFVLELVDGWDLSQILTRTAAVAFPIPSEIALYIVAEICRALALCPLAYPRRTAVGHSAPRRQPPECPHQRSGRGQAYRLRHSQSHGSARADRPGVIKGKLASCRPSRPRAPSSTAAPTCSRWAPCSTCSSPGGARSNPLPTSRPSHECVNAGTPHPRRLCPASMPPWPEIIRRAMARLPSQRYQSADQMLLAVENLQRTVYRPAGQTELKRWLADLQAAIMSHRLPRDWRRP